MVVLRKFVGWLSFLSFVASLILLGAWLYIMTWPYFKGTVSWYGPEPDLDVLSQSLVESVDSQYNRVLRDYISRDVEPAYPATGYEAAVRVLTDYAYFPPLNRVTQGAAAALIDVNDGRVLAAYPRSLEGLRIPFPAHFMDKTDTGGLVLQYGLNYTGYCRWEADFLEKFCGGTNPPYEVRLKPVADQSGEAMGVLAVVYYRAPFVLASEAISYETPEWLLRLSSYRGTPSAPLWPAALLLSIVLLPLWVALDSAWRGMRPIPWTLLVLLTSFIGLFAYLIARLAPPRRCPNCGEMVLAKYKRCPVCGLAIFARCPTCRSRMKPGWQYCPTCSDAGVLSDDEPSQPEMIVTIEPEPVSAESALPRLSLAAAPQVRVQVSDSDTGNPLSEVSLCIEGASVVRGLTNEQGSFDARTLAPGHYQISAHRSGYAPTQMAVDIDEDFRDDVCILLHPLPGAVTGRIIERASIQAVPSARVYLDTDRADISVLTEADGNYSLEDVPAGAYTTRVDCSGFTSQVKLVEVPPGQRVSLDFGLERSSGCEEETQ